MVHPAPGMQRYNTANIQKFLNDIDRYSIGMDEWFNRFDTLHQTEQNYPPFNLIKESNVEFRLEVACAGFRKGNSMCTQSRVNCLLKDKQNPNLKRQNMYTGSRQEKPFTRTWTLSDDVEVGDVNFEDGLLMVKLSGSFLTTRREKFTSK